MIILNKPRRIHSDEATMHCVNSEYSGWIAAHRLDYETSGCLLICSPEAEKDYAALFRSHQTQQSPKAKKLYLASTDKPSLLGPQRLLCEGYIVSRYRRSQKVQFLELNDPAINKKWHSKQHVLHWVQPLKRSSEHPPELTGHLYLVELVSGARHQIRAYFASLQTPLHGDPIYNPDAGSGLSLHAWKLEFIDPLSQQPVSVCADSVLTQ